MSALKLQARLRSGIASLLKPSKAVRRLVRSLRQSREEIEALRTHFATEFKEVDTRSKELELRLRRVEAFSSVAGSMKEAGDIVFDLRTRLEQVEGYTGKLATEEISETVSRLSARLGSLETILSRAETRMTSPRLSSLENHVESLIGRVQVVEEIGARDTARLAALSRRQIQAEIRET